MGVARRIFQSAGQLTSHVTPGGYSRIDSVRGSSGSVSLKNVVILGRCTGGKPATLLSYGTITEAKNVLRSGPLAEAANLAFKPSTDPGRVPQRLYFMRVNSAVQSTLTLDDASTNDMLKLDSIDYGAWTAQLAVTVAAGTSAGKKVTIEYLTNVETFDDISRNMILIEHTNAATTVAITITSATQQMVLSADSHTIDLSLYDTMDSLAAYINTLTGYTATVSSGADDRSPLTMDGCVATAVGAGGYQATAILQAIADTINLNSGYLEATVVNATNNRQIPANISKTFLSGGSEGSYTSTEWSAALTALEAEDVQIVTTPDDDEAVHAAINTHCITMSSTSQRKERQPVFGGAWGDSESTAKTNALALNSKVGTLYAHVGGTQYNLAGELTNFSSCYVACMIAGMFAALALNEPLTFKELNLISLEKKLTPNQIDDLIEHGVAPIGFNDDKVPHIIRQITTYQSDDLKYNEFSVVFEMFYVSRDIRSYINRKTTGIPGNIPLGTVEGLVKNRLTYYAEQGVFTKDDTGKYWWNVILTLSGDALYVDYDANVTLPINFEFITNHFHEATVETVA